MPVKHKKRSATERAAFQRFVELVKPIDAVQYVAAPDEGPLEIFTYLPNLDDEKSIEVFHAEYEVLAEFPNEIADFHVVFLDGRSIGEMFGPRSALFFARQNGER
jgi:hypothetical protein